MGLRLPRLTREVDCEALGYPGIMLTFWLNLDDEEWQPPKVPEGKKANPWDRFAWWRMARAIDKIVVPAKYVEGSEPDDEPTVYEIVDRQTAWELADSGGYSDILIWAVNAYNQCRNEWLASAVKN